MTQQEILPAQTGTDLVVMLYDDLIDGAGEASCKQQRWLLPDDVELIWHQIWHLAGTHGPPYAFLSCPPIMPSYHALPTCPPIMFCC